MSKPQRLESLALVSIVLVVGGGAGWASFNHVHDFTMGNSPVGTPDAFGWVNACVSELVPIASLLEIRRRARNGKRLTAPVVALVAAVAFSLTAQLAVATPTFFGWLVSAAPALAFLGLGKMVLSGVTAKRPDPVVEEPPVVTPPPADVTPVIETVPDPKVDVTPEPVDVKPAATRHPVRRVRPKVLTNAAKVEAAAIELGPDAKPAQIAAKAGVSESTARRYMPRSKPEVASPSGALPAQMLLTA
ncbi:hypothetical protein [Micromonospora sp. CB01531]|uniref:hypothetical protein n=1 Tax=Micromonospora sp. CB01531 TaxID=1718947 RepID=UPI00093A0271|nr:hypothetical protein [Micromonospora sp. CB01531]